MGVGVRVGGKGEGVRVAGSGVEVGEAINRVGVIVGRGREAGAGEQETGSNKRKKAMKARFITKYLTLRGDCFPEPACQGGPIGPASSSQQLMVLNSTALGHRLADLFFELVSLRFVFLQFFEHLLTC